MQSCHKSSICKKKKIISIIKQSSIRYACTLVGESQFIQAKIIFMDYANKHRKETVKIKGQKWRECKSKKSSIPQYPFKCLADSQIYTQYTHSHTDAFL